MTSEIDIELSEDAPACFYFIAGEASGDRHAAYLYQELKHVYPEARAVGVGGESLKAAGQEQLFDLVEHAVVGLTDVLKEYFKFRGFFKRIIKDICLKKPDALILVDYPGFNLRLAKKISKIMPQLPIIYYISPQVWAWKEKRSRLMAEVVDLLLVIFPFEKEWFRKNEPGLRVEWVGHPMLDRWQGEAERDEATDDKVRKIALLPGSRTREIERHMPLLVETARRLAIFLEDLRFIFLAADQEGCRLIEKYIGEMNARGLNYEIHTGYQLTHLCRSDLAIVASGSVTLECCLARLPMLLIYKVNSLTYFIGRKLVKIPYLGMVNILAGEKIVPEFLQERADVDYLVEAIRKVATDKRWRDTMRKKLDRVANDLGNSGASGRAAKAIQDFFANLPEHSKHH